MRFSRLKHNNLFRKLTLKLNSFLKIVQFRNHLLNEIQTFKLGMTTGRVRAGFFHTQTRPTGQDPWPELGPFRVPGFFPRPGLAPARPRLEIRPNSWPNQKKKKKSLYLFFPTFKPRFIFAVQACIFQIKKLSPNLFLPTFKPAYSNSSLDNVAQMPNHRLLIINQ